jgi:hypothetical protein
VLRRDSNLLTASNPDRDEDFSIEYTGRMSILAAGFDEFLTSPSTGAASVSNGPTPNTTANVMLRQNANRFLIFFLRFFVSTNAQPIDSRDLQASILLERRFDVNARLAGRYQSVKG